MPKTESSDLSDLVRSLNKNEAGYFLKFSGRHSAGSGLRYTELFRSLYKGKNSDHLTGERHYSKLKNYLHRSILLSLYSYHTESSPAARIRKMISDIELLYGKALYHQCKKVLKRAIRLSQQYELFNYQTELIAWEIRILQAHTELEKLSRESSRFMNESRAAFASDQNLIEYLILYSRAFSLIRKYGPAKDPASERPYLQILKHPVMTSEKKALSAHATMNHLHIHSVCAYALHRPEQEQQFTRRLVEHMEQHPFLQEAERERYLISLNNYIHSSIRQGRSQQALSTIEKLRAFGHSIRKFSDTQNLQHRAFARSFIYELHLYQLLGEPEKGLKAFRQNEILLKKWKHRMNPANRAELYYRIACIWHLAGDPKQALAWINRILNDKELKPFQQLNIYTQILNLVVHTDLQHYDWVTRNARQLLLTGKIRSGMNQLEFGTVLGLRQISEGASASTNQNRNLISKIESKLLPFKKDPFQNTLLNFFDCYTWLESRRTGIPFQQLIKERHSSRSLA